MSAKSKIEWTDRTWNPVTGCSKVSQGCKNCYAERDWARLSSNPKTVYYGREFTDVAVHLKRLDEPSRWGKPSRVFVNSMSDLFHESVDSLFIAQVFAVMRRNCQHVYQILTKRPDRMREIVSNLHKYPDPYFCDQIAAVAPADGVIYPAKNVWLGVSVEDQETAEARIPELLKIPNVTRFLSVEPMLGPVNLEVPMPGPIVSGNYPPWLIQGGIGWVIVGGESGPNARPMKEEWVLSLLYQCQKHHIPFFFKQWGEHDDKGNHVGKKAAGRLLNGREWNEYPIF